MEEKHISTIMSTLEESENQLEKLHKEEEQATKDDKYTAKIKGLSDICKQLTGQPLISELDRERPEQLPPGKPQFVSRMTQITSKYQTSPAKRLIWHEHRFCTKTF